MAEEGFSNQQQQRNLLHEELNFSINDILNGSADVNDSSFQSIVQTLSDTSHDPSVTSSFANLPAELQDFFSASDTDDLLSTQHNAHDLLFDPQPFIQPVRVNVPSSIPVLAPTQTHVPTTSQVITSSPITLLDNITSQLTPDKKEQFLRLFRGLQTSSVSASEFMTQSKSILGEHQYRQLEDLKSKPTMQASTEDDQKKRKTSTQALSPNVQKKAKSDHIPMPMYQPQPTRIQSHASPILPQQYPVQPNIVTPNVTKSVFKAPSPILQIPSKANVPIPSKPPVTQNIISTGATNSGSGSGNNSSGGGGGGDRVDYDTLTDVMGYAGVDLKEEAEHFTKEDLSGTVLPDGMDRSKFQDFMNPHMLKDKILKCAKSLHIKKIDSDFVSYIALATQDRIRTVLENMVRASRHRTQNSFKKPPEQEGHPMYKIQIKQKVRDQLKAIENAERNKISEFGVERQEGLRWYSKKTKQPLLSIEKERVVTVQDAVFVMERDVQGGRGSNRRTLLKAYNTWST